MNQRKISQISALESKKWSNQQGKSTFLGMIILHMGYLMYYGVFFYHFTTFKILVQKFVKFFVGFLKIKRSKNHSEINWPLETKIQLFKCPIHQKVQNTFGPKLKHFCRVQMILDQTRISFYFFTIDACFMTHIKKFCQITTMFLAWLIHKWKWRH